MGYPGVRGLANRTDGSNGCHIGKGAKNDQSACDIFSNCGLGSGSEFSVGFRTHHSPTPRAIQQGRLSLIREDAGRRLPDCLRQKGNGSLRRHEKIMQACAWHRRRQRLMQYGGGHRLGARATVEHSRWSVLR